MLRDAAECLRRFAEHLGPLCSRAKAELTRVARCQQLGVAAILPSYSANSGLLRSPEETS